MLGISLSGCDDPQPRTPATVPTAKPVDDQPATVPASLPATTQSVRPPSVINIDQTPVEFPPAVLRIRRNDDHLHATLASDDPKAALARDFTGNSFYIELPGEFSEASDLVGKPFVFLNDAKDRRDTMDGFFLEGSRYQLQAQNAKIEISGELPHVHATLSGTFLMFSLKDDTLPGKLVAVEGRLQVDVKQ